MRKDDPLATREYITKDDLYKIPLILPRRNIIRDEVSEVLKLDQTKLNIRATTNLPNNSTILVKQGYYYSLVIKGVLESLGDPDLTFIPFSPNKSTGDVLAWRKNTILSPATEKFLQFVSENNEN